MKKLIFIVFMSFVAWNLFHADWGKYPANIQFPKETKKKKVKRERKVIINREYEKGDPRRVIITYDGDTVVKDEEYYRVLNALKAFRDS